MRVYQLASFVALKDGVSNCVIALDGMLQRMGYDCQIVVQSNQWGEEKNRIIKEVLSFRDLKVEQEDVVFYHFSGEAECIREVERLNCRKVPVFHNVSTPALYRMTSWSTYRSLCTGLEDAKQTCHSFDYAMALSEYSKSNLIEYGWSADKVEVVPIISGNSFMMDPNQTLISKYRDGYRNFLAVGRIAPNKKIEDVIRIFDYYQKNIDENSRLFLVGNIQFKNYYDALNRYIKQTNIKNVVFTDSVLQEQLEAYYELADIFLCMSEHEGFCIPIMEAFQRNIPVVAYKATAVPDTMGGAGMLVDTKEPESVCNKIRELINDADYRNQIVRNQKDRSENFQISGFEEKIRNIIENVELCDGEKGFSYAFSKKIKENPDIAGSEVLEKPFVVYGYGKAGKRFEYYLSESQKKNILTICDNKLADGKQILNHTDCVKNFKECNYIVTISNGYVDVIRDLIADGIEAKNIYCYSLAKNEIKR